MGRRHTNRLAREASPYLLQHAHNPVDWYPWGDEAFAEARRRGVPIFLSIGYSTCYWCHVMERESFENAEIALLMNERLVCVKVDREERPDVDEVYMAATQMLTGRGGWPMSAFLDPASLRPFWAGTYFPPRPAMGMPSFPQIVEGIAAAWRDRRADLLKQAEDVAEAVREHLGGARQAVPIGIPQVAGAVSALLTTYDRVRGGFGNAPKFPQPVYLDLLLSFLPFAGEDESKAAVEGALRHTLDRMAVGGMFDQVGGGFHRYSVDAEWTVPHFEKMLYDNAQLAEVYARAAERFGDEFYSRIACRTLDYVLAEMISPEGAFYSAQDAEVDGREGLNYLWTPEQVGAALPADLAAFAVRVYGLDRGANFRDPHHAHAEPASVLRLEDRPQRVAAAMSIAPDEFARRLIAANAALYRARATRKQPRRDDKVLAGWNGLMIAALSVAGRVLGEARYVAAARAAADHVLDRMGGASATLLRTAPASGKPVPGFLEDYAFVIHGLVELRRAGGDDRYLGEALRLAGQAARRFGDDSGGYFDTPPDKLDLFIRPRSTYDGAVPCGTSVMADNLVDLFDLTTDPIWLERAGRILASISPAVAASPVSTARSTKALLRVIVTDGSLMGRLTPGEQRTDSRPRDDFTPVVILASTDRAAIKRDEPATLTLRLQVAGGYHINAAEPNPDGHADGEGLFGLRVGIAGGGGVAAYADYPPGEPYGPGGSIRVHRGAFELPVVLERDGPWMGKPMLTVTFQACTDTECLAPATVQLDVAIDPA